MSSVSENSDCPHFLSHLSSDFSPQMESVQRRYLMAAVLLGGMGAMAGSALACAPGSMAVAATAAMGPRDVCVECLMRRAQQRSAFVNKEAA